VDLGKQQDFTAISVIEKRIKPVLLDEAGAVDSATLRQRVKPPRYTVRWAERLPLGVDYVEQGRRVAQIMVNPAIRGASLVVDMTGVGRAVVDIFRCDFGLKLTGVTITSGRNVTEDPNGMDFGVPKMDLVSCLQAAFTRGYLVIAQGIPDRQVLAAEFGDFQVKLTDAGTITTGTRSGSHDDLLLSTACALWKLTRTGGRVTRQEFLV